MLYSFFYVHSIEISPLSLLCSTNCIEYFGEFGKPIDKKQAVQKVALPTSAAKLMQKKAAKKADDDDW